MFTENKNYGTDFNQQEKNEGVIYYLRIYIYYWY